MSVNVNEAYINSLREQIKKMQLDEKANEKANEKAIRVPSEKELLLQQENEMLKAKLVEVIKLLDLNGIKHDLK